MGARAVAAAAGGAASSATNITSPMIEEIGASAGGSTASGSADSTVGRRSATACRARWTSAPQSKSTRITATPTDVVERTRRTPDAPASADSIGNVASASRSAGAMPCPSTSTVTVGAVRSGSTSTGIRDAAQPPPASSAAAAASTAGRLRSDHRMSASSGIG